MRSLEAWRFAAEEGAPAGGLLDEAAAAAPTREGWDCAPGCSACCFLLVQITPIEAQALLPHVTAAIVRRIEENAARAEGLDAAAYRRAGIACAFLDPEGRCAAYEARPVRCRSHVSSDVAVCRAVRDGEAPSGAIPGDAWLRSVASAVQRGLGGPPLELHASLRGELRQLRGDVEHPLGPGREIP